MPKKKFKKKQLKPMELIQSLTNPNMPFLKDLVYGFLKDLIKKKFGEKAIGKLLSSCVSPFLYLVFNCLVIPFSHIIRNKRLSEKESKKHEQFWEQKLK